MQLQYRGGFPPSVWQYTFFPGSDAGSRPIKLPSCSFFNAWRGKTLQRDALMKTEDNDFNVVCRVHWQCVPAADHQALGGAAEGAQPQLDLW